MNKNRKYTQTMTMAKKLYKLKTGLEYKISQINTSGISIHKLKIMKTKTRRFFVGTYMEWLNL